MYRILEKSFEKSGFKYFQLAREGDIAIYKRAKTNCSVWHYEVIVIKRHDGRVIGGNEVPPSEMYPNSEQWGIYGFTYNDFVSASKKFRALLRNLDMDGPKRGRPKKNIDKTTETEEDSNNANH